MLLRANIILDHPPGTLITFSNVALLAHDGGVVASNWDQSCGGRCPMFTLQGSAIMNHLSIYGQVGPLQTG